MKTPVDDLQSRNGRKQTQSEIEKNYGNKFAIFVLKTFLCILIPNAHCAPGGTKKTCVKIHQQLCQKKLHYISIMKIVFKTWLQCPCFCKKKSNGKLIN